MRRAGRSPCRRALNLGCGPAALADAHSSASTTVSSSILCVAGLRSVPITSSVGHANPPVSPLPAPSF
jgi:hypothetical protein